MAFSPGAFLLLCLRYRPSNGMGRKSYKTDSGYIGRFLPINNTPVLNLVSYYELE
jgi:hypothetical protein